MKPRGIPIDSLPPRLREEALRQLGKLPPASAIAATTGGEPEMIRQRKSPLNKTEAAWGDELARRLPGRKIRAQEVTLVLANGVRYTPDFFVDPEVADGAHAIAYEVKGFMRDDAAVKIKVAARAWPWISFFLVHRRGRSSPWIVQPVEP